MGRREFEIDPEAKCDSCGTKGALDIYGDYLCPDCASRLFEPESQYEPGDQEDDGEPS